MDAVIIPKVSSPTDIEEVSSILQQLRSGSAAHGAVTGVDSIASPHGGKVLEIWSMIETPRGVQHVDAIAATKFHGVSGQVQHTGLVFGSSDLTKVYFGAS